MTLDSDSGKTCTILALDQGTSSTRSIVFDLSGQIRSIAQVELQQYYPQNAWVEHDAEEIWQAQYKTAQQAIAESGSSIDAIGITNQRETIVLWERDTGKPLHKAIVWQDRRTSDHCAALKQAGHESLITQKTGLILDPYFSATKIAWLLDHIPHARQRAEDGELACGTIDSWLLYKLTAGSVHATDVSNAARTSLMDIDKLCWDDELLQIFNIPKAILPEIKSSAEIYGHCDLFGDSIPISGIAGDQHAALFGQQCLNPGMIKCTYGTGAFIMSQCGPQRKDVNGLLSTLAWKIGDEPAQYALEGAVFSAGSAVQWLRDGLGIITSSADIEALAAQVHDSNDVFFVPAFNGLATPHWDPLARGCIIGLTRDSTAAHIARACLDAIAQQVCDVIDQMRHAQDINALRVDGGAAKNNLLLQTQADLAQLEVHRPQQSECTALGAAWLAAIGAGLCTSEELAWIAETEFAPEIIEQHRSQQRQRWQKAVTRSLNWAVNETN